MPALSRPTCLGPAERGAVLLARADAARFGWEGTARSRIAGAFRRLLAGMTGIEAVQPLADTRLERLRLFACMIRRGDARTDALAAALIADGFCEAALRQAVALALG